MFVPVILGSDKTTVSVATGQNDFWPLYMSTGNVHNKVRRAQADALVLVGFLAIPKSRWSFFSPNLLLTTCPTSADRQHASSEQFRNFRRRMFHTTLEEIFDPLTTFMETPDVVRCSDGYFRRAIYGFGPYIADYPEQVLLACIVQNWCPK